MSQDVADAVAAYRNRVGPEVLAALTRAAARVPALAARLAAAGVDPQAPAGIDAVSSVPVLGKDDLVAAQRADPPYGGLVAAEAPIERVFQSPGPLYEPQLAGPDPWRWAPALAAAGIGAGDTVLNCFGYHLSPAGAMFELGCLALGARVVPGGIGNQDLQVHAIATAGITGYTGLPSYLKVLIDRFEAGVTEGAWPSSSWGLRTALVTAEPLPASLRTELQRRVPVVRMAYGTAEAGLIAYECGAGRPLRPADGLLVEVCDLSTGVPVTQGEGQVVVTLARPDYPLVRFGTGDLSAWVVDEEGQACLAGVLGRVGQAVKVRGMFLHPRQAAEVLSGVPGLKVWRLVVDRHEHRDELRCEVVIEEGAAAGEVAAAVADRIRSGLRFTAEVVPVAQVATPGELADVRTW